MGFAVIHIEKGTAGKAGGLGNHIDRTKNVPNANPAETKYNARVDLQNSSIDSIKWTKIKNELSLQTRINNRIKEGYKGQTAIRKDAVTHMNVVMTGSHKDMNKIISEKQLVKWADDNYKFACERFGKENIVEFAIHLDERTPHIHCVAVPITKDGRLSAKEVMGNREKMTDLQEKYAKAMQKYDLSRGIKGSKATHDSVQEYYARLNNVVNEPKTLDDYKTLSIQKQEEARVFQKQNAQLRGIVVEQDKILNPSKYKEQDQNRGLKR